MQVTKGTYIGILKYFLCIRVKYLPRSKLDRAMLAAAVEILQYAAERAAEMSRLRVNRDESIGRRRICVWLCKLSYEMYIKQRLTLVIVNKQNKRNTAEMLLKLSAVLPAVVCVTWREGSVS